MEFLSRRTVLAGTGALAAIPLIGTTSGSAAPESVIWDGDPARGSRFVTCPAFARKRL